MEVDANRVITELTEQIANLHRDNAILRVQLADLQDSMQASALAGLAGSMNPAEDAPCPTE